MANEFTRPELNQQGIERMEQVGLIFEECLRRLGEVPLVSPEVKGTGARESALVTTKLQEAKMWAERALSVNPDNLR